MLIPKVAVVCAALTLHSSASLQSSRARSPPSTVAWVPPAASLVRLSAVSDAHLTDADLGQGGEGSRGSRGRSSRGRQQQQQQQQRQRQQQRKPRGGQGARGEVSSKPGSGRGQLGALPASAPGAHLDSKGQVIELYRAARRSLRNGQIEHGFKLLQSCVEADPTDSHSWLELARTQARRGNMAEARQAFEEATAYCPCSVHLWQAWAVFEKDHGSPERARELFQEGLLQDPGNQYICHAWGLLEVRDGNLDRARELFETGLEARKSVELAVALAELEATSGDPKAGRERFQQALDEFRLEERGPLLLAWAELEAGAFGDLDRALTLLEQAAKENPRDVKVAVARVHMHVRQGGDLETARKILAAAAQQLKGLREQRVWVDPRQGSSLYNLWATLEAKLGQNVTEAIRLVEEGISRFRGQASLYQTLGTLRDKQRDFARARSAFESSVRINPTAAAYVAWALMEERQSTGQESTEAGALFAEDHEAPARHHPRPASPGLVRARELFEKGIECDRRHGPLYNAYGSMEFRHGFVDKARQVLARGISDRCTDQTHVAHAQGALELRQGNIEKARRIFEDAIKEFGQGDWRDDVSFLIHSLGTLEMQIQNYARACQIFGSGIRQYPTNSQLLLGAALTELRMNEVEAARDLFRRAVRADRRHAHAWQAWGLMENKQGNPQTARTLYEAGLQECPEHGALYQAYGALEVTYGHFERARSLFMQGLDKDTNVAQRGRLLHASACLEVRMGNLDQAKDLLQRALELDPYDAPAWSAFGLVEERRGNLNRARQVFREAIRMVPHRGDLYRNFATMEARLGNLVEARKIFQGGVEADPFHAELFHAYAEMEARLGNIGALQNLHAIAQKFFSEDVVVREAQRILAEKHRSKPLDWGANPTLSSRLNALISGQDVALTMGEQLISPGDELGCEVAMVPDEFANVKDSPVVDARVDE